MNRLWGTNTKAARHLPGHVTRHPVKPHQGRTSLWAPRGTLFIDTHRLASLLPREGVCGGPPVPGCAGLTEVSTAAVFLGRGHQVRARPRQSWPWPLLDTVSWAAVSFWGLGDPARLSCPLILPGSLGDVTSGPLGSASFSPLAPGNRPSLLWPPPEAAAASWGPLSCHGPWAAPGAQGGHRLLSAAASSSWILGSSLNVRPPLHVSLKHKAE